MKFTTISSIIYLFLLIFLAFFSSLKAQNEVILSTIPIIENGQAQIIPEFNDPEKWIRHDLWVETEFDTDGDGKLDRMYVSVTRPHQTESGDLRLPVIYATSPYYAGTADVPNWDVRHELGETPPTRELSPGATRTLTRPIISNSLIRTWVPLGFIVVHSTSPGTGFSDGAPTVGGPNESLGPKAVIDWLNGRAPGYTTRDGFERVEAFWSTGKVGMTGTSYNGTLPLAAATTGVDGLEAIIPVAPNTSYYHYYRANGLVRSPGGYLGEDIDVLYDFIHSGDVEKRDYNNRTVRDIEMAQGMDRITGDYNDFWAVRDYLNHIESVKAAVLMAHAFNDWNVMPEHSYRIYEALRARGVPSMIYYHQGGHGGEPPHELMNKWFTRYLFGVENGVEDLPRSWIVREKDERTNPTAYPDYPHPGAEPVKFYLSPGAPTRGLMSIDEQQSNTFETLVDNVSFSGSALAQAEWTNHRLIYLTPELTDSLHISGVPSVTITLSSSKSAANLSVWMVSLPWTEGRQPRITDNIITRGWADPQNRNSIHKSEPLVPGEFYTVSFSLEPDDQIIPPGQQIGLMIFSSDREYTLWPNPGTELTIDLDSTTLTLPIVGGASSVKFVK